VLAEVPRHPLGGDVVLLHDELLDVVAAVLGEMPDEAVHRPEPDLRVLPLREVDQLGVTPDQVGTTGGALRVADVILPIVGRL
jgi:hypothetical protein